MKGCTTGWDLDCLVIVQKVNELLDSLKCPLTDKISGSEPKVYCHCKKNVAIGELKQVLNDPDADWIDINHLNDLFEDYGHS